MDPQLSEKELLEKIAKISLTDEAAESLYGIARSFYEHGKFLDALNCFRLLSVAKMAISKYWFGLAACQHMLGSYTEAAPSYLIAARLDNENPYPLIHQAECLFSLGCHKEAMQALVEAETRSEGVENEKLQARNRISSLRDSWKSGANNYLNHYYVNHSKI